MFLYAFFCPTHATCFRKYCNCCRNFAYFAFKIVIDIANVIGFLYKGENLASSSS